MSALMLSPNCRTAMHHSVPDGWPHGHPACEYPGYRHPVLGFMKVACSCDCHPTLARPPGRVTDHAQEATMSGTLTNGFATDPWHNPAAPDANWRKATRTDLDPIVKDSVIVTTLPDAEGHPYPRIVDGTRMIGISDDKDEHAPVLAFSRVEFRIFAEAIIEGQFTEFYASDAEMAAAGKELADVAGS